MGPAVAEARFRTESAWTDIDFVPAFCLLLFLLRLPAPHWLPHFAQFRRAPPRPELQSIACITRHRAPGQPLCRPAINSPLFDFPHVQGNRPTVSVAFLRLLAAASKHGLGGGCPLRQRW